MSTRRKIRKFPVMARVVKYRGVRDGICTGLAYLVHAAYDCEACALGMHDEAFHSFISSATANWFRDRGFAEWFCSAAASQFSTSRPRILSERILPRVLKIRTVREKR